MFDNAYKLSQIRKNNAYADAQDAKALGTENVTPGAELAKGLTYSNLTGQIKNRIAAEYFAGVQRKSENFPNTQLDSLSGQMVQDVNTLVLAGVDLNQAIDRVMNKAETQGALSKKTVTPGKYFGTNKISARADASKYTAKTYSMKALLAKNKDATEEQIRAAVNAQPNATLID